MATKEQKMIVDALKRLQVERGAPGKPLTQAQLAELLGYGVRTIVNAMKGDFAGKFAARVMSELNGTKEKHSASAILKAGRWVVGQPDTRSPDRDVLVETVVTHVAEPVLVMHAVMKRGKNAEGGAILEFNHHFAGEPATVAQGAGIVEAAKKVAEDDLYARSLAAAEIQMRELKQAQAEKAFREREMSTIVGVETSPDLKRALREAGMPGLIGDLQSMTHLEIAGMIREEIKFCERRARDIRESIDNLVEGIAVGNLTAERAADRVRELTGRLHLEGRHMGQREKLLGILDLLNAGEQRGEVSEQLRWIGAKAVSMLPLAHKETVRGKREESEIERVTGWARTTKEEDEMAEQVFAARAVSVEEIDAMFEGIEEGELTEEQLEARRASDERKAVTALRNAIERGDDASTIVRIAEKYLS